MKPNLVVFDLDDTLYLERDYVHSGLMAVADFLLREHHIEGFLPAAWQVFIEGIRGKIFDEAMTRLGKPLNVNLVPIMVEVYRQHQPRIAPADGALTVLGKLQARSQLGLISDGTFTAQQRKLYALGLANYFDQVTLTDRWGREYWKPHPRAFIEMQHSAGLPPERCIYIGDNPAKDFMAPRQLGWRSIRLRLPGGLHEGVAPSEPGCEPDSTVGSWRLLGEQLDRVCRLD